MADPTSSIKLTLDAYTHAIRDLPIEQVYAELKRLDKSEHRLLDTNAQLRQEEPCTEFTEAIAENEVLLAAYVFRREAIHDHLRSCGASVPAQVAAGRPEGPNLETQGTESSPALVSSQGVFL